MEALHNVMLANNQILGVYDKMSIMYGQLDAYKHSSSHLDHSTPLKLYNGGSWCRNFKYREEDMTKKHHTAFILKLYSCFNDSFLSAYKRWNINTISLRLRWILPFLTSNTFLAGSKKCTRNGALHL